MESDAILKFNVGSLLKGLKKPISPELNDMLSRLLVVDPEKRMSWDAFFSHPFCVASNQHFMKAQRQLAELKVY
jgi:hypothetical protein